ncbi:MAG TPA: GGDEF domain-containing protein [Thermoanaerobaculia bacterium]|nr:GGDEF domain-containing protein [Thermoanaerobaculia bacterium]
MRLAMVAMLVAASLGAAESERGRVGVRNLRTRDVEALGAKAGPQNFAIAQDQRGLVYLANNLGVVELDQHAARLITLPHRASALSLDLDRDNRIWVGGSGNLGYLAPDGQGELAFVSLLDRVPAAARDFGDVWQTSVARDGIYFRTPTHLLRWNGGAFHVWTAPNGFHIGNVVDGRLIVRRNGIGLSTVERDRLTLLPGGERFAEEKVYVILPYGDGRLFLIGRTSGVVLFDPSGKRPPESRTTEADAFLREGQSYSGAALADGTFAIATLRGGVGIVDREGRLLERFDKKRGLNDDMVFHVLQARDRKLWLGLNYGVSIVDDAAPVTKLPNDGELGFEGFVESIARYEGRLFISTSRGVFRMTPGEGAEGEPRFAPIAGIDTQCYTLLPAAGTLLAATRDGILQLDGDRKVLVDGDFAYHLAPARRNPNRVVVAYDDGVGVLEHGPQGWRVLARNREAGNVGVSIVDMGNGELWAGTESDGLYQLRLEEGGAPRLVLVQRFDAKHGLPEGWVYPQLIDGRLLFLTREGIFRRDGNRYRPDEAFAASLGARQAFRVDPSGDGKTLWVVSDNRIFRLDKGKNGWTNVPIGIRDIGGGGRILSFLPEGGVLWIGGDDGLFRYVPSRDRRPPPPRALIREARLGDGTRLFGGSGNVAVAPIPHARNTIRFTVAAAPGSDAELMWKLDGFDRDWSPPGRDARKEYTNLPGGDFTFRVAARDVYGQRGPQSAWSFTVRPPWYAAWWARVLFAAGAVLLLALLSRMRGAQLRRRNQELERIVEAKTAELREASHTDPLTGLRNRRYFGDVLAGERGPMLLVLIDLDYFKTVNDRYGHSAGDSVLIETARRLEAVAGPDDLLFRWGGEEFLLVARGPGAAGEELVRRVLAAVESVPFRANGDPIPLTASIGWAPFPQSAATLEGALDLADRALYQAKNEGRNRAVRAMG